MERTKWTGRFRASRVALATSGAGFEFILDRGPYDAECRDRIASVYPGLVESCEILTRAFGADGAQLVADQLHSRDAVVRLPRPVTVRVRFVKREW